MITRQRKKTETITPIQTTKSSIRSKKNDSSSTIDDYLEALMQQLAIGPITESCEEMRVTIPIDYRDISSMEKPKALFITGAPGSGKTFLMTQLFPADFKYALYNADLYQEHLLKVNGLLGNKEREIAIRQELKAENPKITEEALDKLTQSRIASIMATSMAISQKCIREDFDEMISKKLPIVIDRPGDRTSTVLEDKKRLEKEGYQVMMVMIYVSPITALQRNQKRDRHVHPPRILDAWIGCMKNIATYKKVFGDNFFLIHNDSMPFEINLSDLESYLPYASQLEKYVKPIQNLMKKPYDDSSIDTTRQAIRLFLEQKGGKRKANDSITNTKRLKNKK